MFGIVIRDILKVFVVCVLYSIVDEVFVDERSVLKVL